MDSAQNMSSSSCDFISQLVRLYSPNPHAEDVIKVLSSSEAVQIFLNDPLERMLCIYGPSDSNHGVSKNNKKKWLWGILYALRILLCGLCSNLLNIRDYITTFIHLLLNLPTPLLSFPP